MNLKNKIIMIYNNYKLMDYRIQNLINKKK